MSSKQNKDRYIGILNILYAIIALVFFSLSCVVFVLLLPMLSNKLYNGIPNYAVVDQKLIQYNLEREKSIENMKEALAEGSYGRDVIIDGKLLSNVFTDEVNNYIQNDNNFQPKKFQVLLNIGNKEWSFDNSNINIYRKKSSINGLPRANVRSYKIEDFSAKSPLESRYNLLSTPKQEALEYQSEWHYDRRDVENIVDNIVAYINRPPIDSQIESFDFNTRTFSFTEDHDGISVNRAEILNMLYDALDKLPEKEVLYYQAKVEKAKAQKSDMEKNFKMIAAYTTNTTKNKDRNSNISLACKSINGYVLESGKTFSFNEVVGERTTNKGYKQAGAISKGKMIQDVGGGVCQVSTTLYNAVVRADLEIVKRRNHAWPISYISIGEDAAVNWPNLDLKFKNNQDNPIFIVMYYNDQKASAEIYGMSLGEGVNIDLHSDIVKTLKPDGGIAYVYNPELAVGTQNVSVKDRQGYIVDTYKIWYKDGKETKREKLHTTTYKPYQKTIEYNDGMGQ